MNLRANRTRSTRMRATRKGATGKTKKRATGKIKKKATRKRVTGNLGLIWRKQKNWKAREVNMGLKLNH